MRSGVHVAEANFIAIGLETESPCAVGKRYDFLVWEYNGVVKHNIWTLSMVVAMLIAFLVVNALPAAFFEIEPV